MALASTVPASFICRRASWATLAAVMPVGLTLALVLSTLPPNMGLSSGDKLWAATATATLAPRSRKITTRYLIPKVPHQSELQLAAPQMDWISTRFHQILLHAKHGLWPVSNRRLQPTCRRSLGDPNLPVATVSY